MTKLVKVIALISLLALGTTAFAATRAFGTNTVAPTLQINATVQQSVQLTLVTGTTAPLHCAVTPGGNPPDYTMTFGAVDGLGINPGNCNMFAPAVPGTDPAIYWTDYNLLPVFTGQTSANGTITARVTTNFTGPNVYVVRNTANTAALPANAAAFSAMGTATADTIGTAVTSGSTQTRYIGLAVTPASGAGMVQGAATATVTFTLTVP